MVSTMKYLFIGIVLFAFSTCSATNDPGLPSTITVKEDFNSPAIITPVSAYGPPPMISNFVHQGTNFFFNPQFLLGNNVPPPLGAVVAAISNPPNVEVIVNETVSPPEQPIVTPVEVIVEEPIEVIAPPPPPPLISIIPEVPKLPVLPDIPPAPVLPPLVLPKIPVWVEESIEVVPPCQDKEIIITEIKPLSPVIIPHAPSLPPLVLPPKMSVSEIEIKPQLPVEVSTIDVPVVPKKDISMKFSKVKLTNEESLQLIPKLPISEIDFKINEIPNTIEFTDIENMLSVNEDKTVIMMPPRPELPVIDIPKPISEVLVIEKDKELKLPTLFPTDCARNIVLERVLPNMISKKTVTKSLEIISFPASKYPVVAQIPAF